MSFFHYSPTRKEYLAMTQAFNDLTTAVNALTTAVNDAVAGAGGTPDSALVPVTAQVNSLASALNAAFPPPAPPAQ